MPSGHAPAEGRLTRNIAHFARALRRAGLPIGPGRIVDALRAVQAVGFDHKADFYWTLHAVFVNRPEEREIFAQVFRLYWRDPAFAEHLMAALIPMVQVDRVPEKAKPGQRRAAEALLDDQTRDIPQPPDGGTEIEIDASGTATAAERLRTLDFELMGTAEITAARAILSRMTWPVDPLRSRRFVTGPGHLIDGRTTLRAALRLGGEVTTLVTRARRERRPHLVALCDISGSMAAYSRTLLHFLHAIMNAPTRPWARVHAFTFGTRLTNITRHLARRDVDQALAAAGAEAQDWSGGTRIGDSIATFNRDWSRRVMGQGAVVLLVTDGLERGDPDVLSAAMQRLRLSARAVIWLNPLLRWDGFAPRAGGVRAMLPHVTHLRGGHSIASLQGLATALSDRQGGDLARVRALQGG
jgi:uncharacterized protein